MLARCGVLKRTPVRGVTSCGDFSNDLSVRGCARVFASKTDTQRGFRYEKNRARQGSNLQPSAPEAELLHDCDHVDFRFCDNVLFVSRTSIVTGGDLCGGKIATGIYRTTRGWRLFVRIRGKLLTHRIVDRAHAMSAETLIITRAEWRREFTGRRRSGPAPTLSATEVSAFVTKLPERFLKKVTIGRNCWRWRGALAKGYGRYWQAGAVRQAHVFAYEQCVGPITEGAELDHLCRVRSCVNPRHVEPVEHRENILRGESPPAQQARRTHCRNGHLLAASSGQRRCPTCYPARRSRALRTPSDRRYRLCACGCGRPLLPDLLAKPSSRFLPFHRSGAAI